MSDRKRIIDRIKKLFSVTTTHGATEAEAVAAALAAQRLIADNNVEEWELGNTDEEPIETASIKRTRKWQSLLAATIAENFRCKMYYTTGRGSTNICFYGYASDANAALLTFSHLAKICANLANEYANERIIRCVEEDYTPETWMYEQLIKELKQECKGMLVDTYAQAFTQGVASELEKQSVALMITTPPKVNDRFEEFIADAKEFSTTTRAGHDPEIQEIGFAAGRDAIRAGRIAQADDSWLLESA